MRNNGPIGTGFSANATTQDLALAFDVPCNPTPATTVGATCSVTTSIDAVLGGNTAIEAPGSAL